MDIEFKNGSYIKTIDTISKPIRGKRASNIEFLIDDDVPSFDNVIDETLKSFMRGKRANLDMMDDAALIYISSKGNKMNLIEALQKQIEFCKIQKRYKCGIYVTSKKRQKIVMEVISNILPIPNHLAKLWYSSSEARADFDNGSLIKIIIANDCARGCNFNGVIVDSEISKDIIDVIITPAIIPILAENGATNRNDDPSLRCYCVGISYDDIQQSENTLTGTQRKFFEEQLQFGTLMPWERELYNRMLGNKNIRDKEYKGMFYENDYDHPILTKEINNDKVLLYEAWGILKENITYSTEFINKTKQTYLNVIGKHEMPELGFENDINIHLHIDTDVYDSYEVNIENGMIMIILHEIKNEVPKLEDVSVSKSE